MTNSKAVIASLLISLLIMHIVEANEMMNDMVMAPASLPKIDCGGACKKRCSSSSRPNVCLRACGTCCSRCKCVPPGTSGNKNVCPCYANMTTHGGIPKCP